MKLDSGGGGDIVGGRLSGLIRCETMGWSIWLWFFAVGNGKGVDNVDSICIDMWPDQIVLVFDVSIGLFIFFVNHDVGFSGSHSISSLSLTTLFGGREEETWFDG
jgi:hypothetical protein